MYKKKRIFILYNIFVIICIINFVNMKIDINEFYKNNNRRLKML